MVMRLILILLWRLFGRTLFVDLLFDVGEEFIHD